MSASIREQVARKMFVTQCPGMQDAGAYWDKPRRHEDFKDVYFSLSDAALAVVRDAVLAEIDGRIAETEHHIDWQEAENYALSDLRAAVAELLEA